MVTRSPFSTLRLRRMLASLQTSSCSCLIGDVPGLRRIVAFPDDGGLLRARRQMPIDAVVGGVEAAVLEPLDRDIARPERRVLDLARRTVPVQALGLFRPEAVRVLDRARVHLLVLGRVDIGALRPLRRDIVDFVRHVFASSIPRCAGGSRAHGSFPRQVPCSVISDRRHYATGGARPTRLRMFDFSGPNGPRAANHVCCRTLVPRGKPSCASIRGSSVHGSSVHGCAPSA